MFGAVSLTKNDDIDQYKYLLCAIDLFSKYSGHGIGFDRKGEFLVGSRGFGRNCLIVRADMSSSIHANNRTNNILVLGKDFVQGIDGTTSYAEKVYSVNFTENNNQKFCLSLH